MLRNLQVGNWVVLRNGKRKYVSQVEPHQINGKEVYLVEYGDTSKSLAYNLEGDRLFMDGVDSKDIVSVWDHRPKRREIMAMIKKCSIINFRDGKRRVVKEIHKGNALLYPHFVITHDFGGTFTDKGRTIFRLKSSNDIMSVENGGL